MGLLFDKLNYDSYIFLYRLYKPLKSIGGHTYMIEKAPSGIEKEICTLEDFKSVLTDDVKANISNFEKDLSDRIAKDKYKKVFIKGYCRVCKKNTKFEYVFSPDTHENGNMNWRESMCCCSCGFNNRIRYMIDEIHNAVGKDKQIYITEQVTMLYKYMKSRYANTIGSEYVSPSCEGGKEYNGIRHEDMMNLSFESESLDCVVSADVLEHVSDIKKALDDVYRVLKKGGCFIFSVPFLYDKADSEVRSILENGEVKHLLPPEIHGNPMSNEGSLVFTIPAWDVIEYCKTIFADVKVKFYFIPQQGHMANASGVPQTIFKMIK